MSVKDFINKCFEYIGVKIVWSGKGINEIAKVKYTKIKNKSPENWSCCYRLIKDILDLWKFLIYLVTLQKRKNLVGNLKSVLIK